MYKEKLTFTNFNDEEVTETLRFNLSEIELMDLVKDDPTFSQSYFKTLIDNGDAYEMFRFVRKILALSYGELSNDGNTFMKSPEIMDRFLHSAAYDALINKIAGSSDVDVLKNMLMGIFPAKFATAVQGLDKPEVVTVANA
jgi:hypothetical protein